MAERDQLGGTLRALMAAFLFGSATPLTKDLLQGLPTNLLAGLLYLGAALVVLPPLLHQGSLNLPRDRRNRLRLLGATAVGGVLAPVLLLSGLSLARAASVSMWLNLEVVATAILAVLFFKEHLGRRTWLGNLLMLAAGVLLSVDAGRAGVPGAILVAGAAISWALDNNLTAVIDGMSPLGITFWKGLVAGVTNIALATAFFPVPTVGRLWLFALLVGGLSYGLSIWLYISSAQMLGASRSQTVFATAPFFGVIMSLVWLAEPLSLLQAVAGLLVLASVLLLQLDRHAHEHLHEAISHAHEHVHDDGHHDHQHPDLEPSVRHSHEHDHVRLVHAHPHWPDLHHRHDHSPGAQ